MQYQEINGDLVTLAKEGKFNVIAHGCNCFCTMGAGIAPHMALVFGCDKFRLEDSAYKGDINKLGQIDYVRIPDGVWVINAYTQYGVSRHVRALDYDALTLCLRKINFRFNGRHIGLPKIGCGLAGGDWKVVKEIIIKELSSCDVTIVIYNNH